MLVLVYGGGQSRSQTAVTNNMLVLMYGSDQSRGQTVVTPWLTFSLRSWPLALKCKL